LPQSQELVVLVVSGQPTVLKLLGVQVSLELEGQAIYDSLAKVVRELLEVLGLPMVLNLLVVWVLAQ
jgi:hypothetical protein